MLRFLFRLRSGRAAPKATPPSPALDPVNELTELGGLTLHPVITLIAETADGAGFRLKIDSPPETAFLAVTCSLTAHREAMLVMLAQVGNVLDHAAVSVGIGRQTITLCCPAISGDFIIGASAADRQPPDCGFKIERVTAFRASDVAAGALRAMGPLVPEPHWARYYGVPDRHDAKWCVRSVAYELLPAPIRARWLGGVSLWLEPRNDIGRTIYLSGTYEPETLVVIARLLPKGGTFIDVGANIGLYTLFSAACVGPDGRVLAFEPSTREYRRLEANLALNQLSHISVFKNAVMDAETTVRLRLADDRHAGLNTVGDRFVYAGVGLAGLEDVTAVTLDGVSTRLGLTRCDMIKMDVEGAELKALHGAVGLLRRLQPVLILEILESALEANSASPAALFAWLAGEGYTPYDIDHATGGLIPLSDAWKKGINIVALPQGMTPR